MADREVRTFVETMEFVEGLGGIRPDRMTSRERMGNLLQGKPIDRVPFVPFIYGFTGLNIGYSLEEFWSDGRKMFEAQIRSRQMYDFDGNPMFTYADYGPWEFGGEIKYPTGEWTMAPIVTRRAVQTEEDAWNLKLPDVRTAGSLPVGLEFSKLQRKFDMPAMPPSAGVFNLAGNLVGAETWCRWLISKPDVCHHLLRLALEHRIQVLEYWIEVFGPGNVQARDGSALESNQLVSPEMFRDFALPYIQELHERILALPVIPHIPTHICGDNNLNLPYWAQVDFGDPGLCSIGHEVDIDYAIEVLGERNVIMGNVNPTTIQSSRPEQVYEECRQAIEKGKKAPRGFILMSGCEVPAKAPPYNIWVMRKAVSDFGWYG
jgi:uroporphyrinogen decarboxylase